MAVAEISDVTDTNHLQNLFFILSYYTLYIFLNQIPLKVVATMKQNKHPGPNPDL